jgi:hypothetical protein
MKLKEIIIFVISTVNICCTQNRNAILNIQYDQQFTRGQIGNSDYYISLPNNYYINYVRGKDGIIYYIISMEENDEIIHGEIFFGNFPGRINQIYDDKIMVETIESKIFEINRKWNIYFDNNNYFTGVVIKNNNGNSSEQYIRILGKGKTKEEIINLINIYSSIYKRTNGT